MAVIVLHVDGQDYSLPGDNYEKLSSPDLERLLQQSRETALSFELELKRRNLGGEYYEKLRTQAENLRVTKCLDGKTTNLVNNASKVLRAKQTKRHPLIYQSFLRNIQSQCGSAVAFLCAACFGTERINRLTVQKRIDLTKVIITNSESLQFDVLDELVIKHDWPLEDEVQPE
ncbi:MAG: hypothetical protein MMC23_000894 [Stictis urceolatum]|nr:hypothetical protein [Stictis urceolata]